jgi:methionyl-tRNA formyltransferase
MKLTILTDNPKSWYYPYSKKLQKELSRKHKVTFCESVTDVKKGDCLFILSVEHIVKNNILKKNKHNIVVHSSALPKGKGWSPITWQVLGGKNDIVNTLFEAVEKVDAGAIYEQEVIHLEGHELLTEIHQKQATSIRNLIFRFLNKLPDVKGEKQSGQESFYRRRSADDSEIDVNKTIAEQFNLLRVVDNKKYPAFFEYRGHRYILKIFRNG